MKYIKHPKNNIKKIATILKYEWKQPFEKMYKDNENKINIEISRYNVFSVNRNEGNNNMQTAK